MKISKQDALTWFTFFSQLPPGEALMPWQQEIAFATFAQIERAVEWRRKVLLAGIPRLKSLDGRTVYVGPDEGFAPGCRSCLTGTGLCAIRKTNKCNLQCPFCYDFGQIEQIPPIGEGMWEIGGTRFYDEDIPLLLELHKKPTGVAYVYLEPFCEIEVYAPVIRTFHKAGVYQHMYTNGTLCTPQNLRMLANAGLDELRFNLGASGASDHVLQSMAEAARVLPHVGVETPMTPAFYDTLMEKKDAILQTGIQFMNLAELHLNENNLTNYVGESLYLCRQGYLSPIWSRDLTLRVMQQASRERWPVTVHDCSNRTKFARDLHLSAVEGGWFGQSAYGCEFDPLPYEAFLPVLMDEDFPFVEEEPLPKSYRPDTLCL